jgi:uncharacterized damage-inducible protein DinB
MASFVEPSPGPATPGELFARYLEYYRESAIERVSALTPEDQRASRLPSGWSPLELLNHLAYMEQRWFVWGFLGEQVDAPWGDRLDDQWHVDPWTDVDDVVRMLRGVGERTTAILSSHALDEVARTGGRFEDEPPSLLWICFHVLQEYARHVGHLDIVVELAGGPTGE